MLLPVFLLLAAIATISLGGAQMLALDAKAKNGARIARYEQIALGAAESNLVTYLAQVEQTDLTANAPDAIPNAPPAMASTSLCDAQIPCGFSTTATYAFDGTTETAVVGGATQAMNVERNAIVSERRFGVTITLDITDQNGWVSHVRPQRKTARMWGLAPYAEILGDQDSAARSNRVATGAADMGGCARNGTGCDPSALSSPDPTTIDARTQCSDAINVGSGVCNGPSDMRNVEQKSNINYTNTQQTQSNGP